MRPDGRLSALRGLWEGTASLGVERRPVSIEAPAWAAFGIRDPSPLTDPVGTPVGGALYFNGRDRDPKDGGVTQVGRATRDGAEWAVDPAPAFTDGDYAAQGSVIQTTDGLRVYYSPDTAAGLAVASHDGKRWEKHGIVLTPDQFGVRRLGLPVVRQVGGRWLMVCEGLQAPRFSIFMATSQDGLTWTPANDGQAIYDPPAGNWDAFGQANPCLETDPATGETFVLYNGCAARSEWEIGLLRADAPEGPYQGRPEPIVPRPPGYAGRLEGARLLSPQELVLFDLPTENSYQQGRIFTVAISDGVASERAANDKLADRYFDIWDRFPIARFTTDIETQWLRELIEPKTRVLVLGSGGGRELQVLLDLDCAITAVDLSEAMLAKGRARYPDSSIDWIQADWHDLPADLRDFGAAVSLGQGFAYLQDPARCLANTRDTLRPAGLLIVSSFNADHPSESTGTREHADGRVRRVYTEPGLKQLVAEAGFTDVRTRGLRHLVDLLPPKWNRNPDADPAAARLLATLLEAERDLVTLLPPAKAKLLWVIATA